MVTIQDVLSAINTVGFPIVAYAAMFWKINKQDEQHSEEVKTLAKAIENNTMALTTLKESFEREI